MSLPYDTQKALRSLRRKDQQLATIIRTIGPCRLALNSGQSPFASVFRAIVYQQLSGKAAGTIHNRVLELFTHQTLTPEQTLALPDETLRNAGMSRAKTAAVKDLAAKTLQGIVPDTAELHALSDEDIIERLITVRGVGRWTAEMLLIFNLGRPDVLPVDDLAVRKGFMVTYDLPDMPTRAAVKTQGERWRPYRSVASWYLWRASELPAANKPQSADSD